LLATLATAISYMTRTLVDVVSLPDSD
jgi:hypothetical protein